VENSGLIGVVIWVPLGVMHLVRLGLCTWCGWGYAADAAEG
jgi:hypothetical protein